MRIYRAAVSAERVAWIEDWQAWSEREPFAHPAYAEAFLRPGEQAIALVGEGVFMPIVVRPLQDGRCDLVTPYGYGGPYRTGEGYGEAFWDAAEAWAVDQGAVSLFARMPLFAPGVFRGEVVHASDNVVVDLTVPSEVRWMDYDAKVRQSVKRAQRVGFRVEIDPEGSRLDDFLRIYEGTMSRRDAGEMYRFDRTFFEGMMHELSDAMTFFHTVGEDGRVVSSDLVLHGPRNAYSFLSGTDATAFADRPNHLLKHTIHEWGTEVGKSTFVMGGGYRPNDGIFNYKRSFAPNGIVPFCVGRRVLDEIANTALIAERRNREAGWNPSEGFFPAYRAPGRPREEAVAA